ncbi:MAG: alpha/beta hydrolase [Candidatus Promineofilum sp.]|nr:alpha/beta hydrolase [Promineifilum sp.]
MPTIVIGGESIFFTQNNSQVLDPAVLFIHGAASSSAVWPSTLTNLSNIHSIALDLPGHGASLPPGRRSIEQYAQVVEHFIVAQALSRAVLVGHSMGSAVALSIAHRAAVDLGGLFLLGAAARMPVSDAILTGSVNSLSVVASWIAANALIEATPAQRDTIHRQVLETGGTTTYGDFLACNRFDLRAEVASIASPALVVAGTLDRMTPLRYSESLAAGLPNGRMATLEGCGHFTMVERTEAIKNLLIDFLSELNAASDL